VSYTILETMENKRKNYGEKEQWGWT